MRFARLHAVVLLLKVVVARLVRSVVVQRGSVALVGDVVVALAVVPPVPVQLVLVVVVAMVVVRV